MAKEDIPNLNFLFLPRVFRKTSLVYGKVDATGVAGGLRAKPPKDMVVAVRNAGAGAGVPAVATQVVYPCWFFEVDNVAAGRYDVVVEEFYWEERKCSSNQVAVEVGPLHG